MLPPMLADTIAMVGSHDAVTMHLPWGVAWILGILILTGLGTILINVQDLWAAILTRLGWR